MTLLLFSLSVQNLFKLLDQFEKLSGLKVNYTKTEAMWIGSSRDNTETPLSLKWCKTVKALGIHFSYNKEELLQKNFMIKSQTSKNKYICGVGEVFLYLVKFPL